MQVVGSNWPKPHYTLLITGLCRFRVAQLLKERPFPLAEVVQLDQLEQLTNGSEGELGELGERFYQAAVQVGGWWFCRVVGVGVCGVICEHLKICNKQKENKLKEK